MDIYVLIDPAHPDVVRYVGKTKSARGRLRDHLTDGRKRRHTRKSRWIASLFDHGRQPEMVVIDEAETNDEAAWLERLYIAVCRSLRVPLTNATDGGDGTPGLCGQVHTVDARLRMSETQRLRWKDPEIRARRLPTLTACASPEARAKAAAWHRGRKRSPETRARMSAAANRSPEVRARMSAAALRRGATPMMLAAIRAAAAMRVGTPAAHPHSQETKDKIRAKQRAHWEAIKDPAQRTLLTATARHALAMAVAQKEHAHG